MECKICHLNAIFLLSNAECNHHPIRMLILGLFWGPTEESQIIYQESKVVKCLLNLLFLTLMHLIGGIVRLVLLC